MAWDRRAAGFRVLLSCYLLGLCGLYSGDERKALPSPGDCALALASSNSRPLAFGGGGQRRWRVPRRARADGADFDTEQGVLALGVPQEHAAKVVALRRELRDLESRELLHPMMLVRFLTFLGTVPAAASAVREAAAWRAEVRLESLMREWGKPDKADGLPWRLSPSSRRATVAYTHACAGRAHGLTKAGRPFIVARPGHCDFAGVAREGLSNVMTNQFIFVLEDILQAGHALSLRRKELVWGVIVADIRGVSFSTLRYFRDLQEMSRIANQYYPDLVDAIILVNAPMVFTQMWRVVSTLFHSSTRRKIQILGRDFSGKLEELGISEDGSLPPLLGGEGDDRGLPLCRPVPEGAGRGLDTRLGG